MPQSPNESKCCPKCSKSREAVSQLNPFGRTIYFCSDPSCSCHHPINREWETTIEKLAAIEHERWADWQKYCHSKGIRDSSGIRLTIDSVERWERQINTPYAALSEKEKESDREQVRRYWPLIESLLHSEREKAYERGRLAELEDSVGAEIVIAKAEIAKHTNALRTSLCEKIEGIDVSTMTYGAFRRHVLDIVRGK